MIRFVITSVMLASFLNYSQAQEKIDTKVELQRWQEYYQAVAGAYDFYLASDDKHKLTVSPKSLMSYSHPSAMKGTYGSFFVWTRSGRPELIGSIWSERVDGGQRIVMHEFHSLSLEAFAPTKVGRYTWAPKTGINLKPIPNAAPPSPSKNVRKAQLRSLARKFAGYTSADGPKEVPLRMPPEPIYRYESDLSEVLDGAIFAMFKEWDPEIMLLIEARQTPDGKKWFFGAGRFNGCDLRLTFRGENVWQVGPTPSAYPRFGAKEGVFFAVHLVDRQSAANPEIPNVTGKQ